jgi:hypothetical protein
LGSSLIAFQAAVYNLEACGVFDGAQTMSRYKIVALINVRFAKI